MSINPKCDKCGSELDDYGGIVFSPPNKSGHYSKCHLCGSCYDKFIKWCEQSRFAGDAPRTSWQWLEVVISRIKAGEPEAEVMADYGYEKQSRPAVDAVEKVIQYDPQTGESMNVLLRNGWKWKIEYTTDKKGT